MNNCVGLVFFCFWLQGNVCGAGSTASFQSLGEGTKLQATDENYHFYLVGETIVSK